MLLLKIALLVGVRVRPKTEFKDIRVPNIRLLSEDHEEDFKCDVLVGADGEHSLVSEKGGFETKTFRAGFAIGITANFENLNTSEELIEEFGFISYARKDFFNSLKDTFKIDLENLIYYRETTHYFVMTATKDSLLTRGVLLKDQEMSNLLVDENINREELNQYVRDIATTIGLPQKCNFALNHRGTPDVDIFDFTKKDSSIAPIRILKGNNEEKLLVALIGDALVAPFWPLGTGANRALLGALDTAYLLTKYRPDVDLEALQKQQTDIFKQMENSSPDTLTDQYSNWSIDPETRYKKHITLLA